MSVNKKELLNKFLNSTKLVVKFEEYGFEFVLKKMSVVEARKIASLSEKTNNTFEISLLMNQLESVKGVKFKHIIINEEDFNNYTEEELEEEIGKEFELLEFFFTKYPQVFEGLFIKLGEMLDEMRKSIEVIKKK